MSTILKALEKISAADERREALSSDREGSRSVPFLRVPRTVAVPDSVLRRAEWISALAAPPVEARVFAAVAEHVQERVPPPARILVCGAAPNAGTTAAALNLATEIALSGRAGALWSEIPTRPSSMPRILGSMCTHGLWDHLFRGLPLREVILRTHVPGLVLLPSRGSRSSPSDRPTLEALSGFYEEACGLAKDRYVVVDAPPPLMSRETAALAKRCEVTVLVVPAGAPRGLVRKSADALAGAPRIAVLLTRVAPWQNAGPSPRDEEG